MKKANTIKATQLIKQRIQEIQSQKDTKTRPLSGKQDKNISFHDDAWDGW